MSNEGCPVKARLLELIASPDCPDPKVRIIETKPEKRTRGGSAFHEVKRLFRPMTDTVNVIGTRVIVSRLKEVREYHLPSSEGHLMTPYIANGLIGVLS